MKKFLAVVLALIMCLQLIACGTMTTSTQHTERTVNTDTTWAVYWYLCGSNLESQGGCATTDLMEALEVSLPKNITLVIETGGAKSWRNNVMSASSLERWVINSEGLNKVGSVASDSMGESETLEDFLDFAHTNYPADRTAVLFWNHGGGSTSGVSFDELYDMDYLNLSEMYEAFANVWEADLDNPPIDLVGFDTCLMATVDTAYTFSDIAHYLVASEEVEPGNGWNYTGWLDKLAANPDMDGEELGKAICDAYYTGCQQDGTASEATLSLVDLTKVGDLVKAYEDFGGEVLVQATTDSSFLATFSRAAIKTENYGGNTRESGYANMLDIGHLARLTQDTLSSASAVLEGLDECVLYQVAGPYRSEATGLSGYYSYDGSVNNLNGYLENGVSESFKYLYTYELTGQLLDGGKEYIQNLNIDSMPEVQTISSAGWDGIGLTANDNGLAVLNLGTEANDVLTDIQFALYYLDQDNESMMYLGTDDDITADWTKGEFCDNFRGVWPALNGIPLLTELSFRGDDYNVYASPILLNGEEYSLYYVYQFSTEKWAIVGALPGIDENGMGGKEVRQLEEGDEISIIWEIRGLEDEDEMEMYEATTITVDEDLELSEVSLPNGSYIEVFMMWDASGYCAVSDGVVFDVDGGEITTTIF